MNLLNGFINVVIIGLLLTGCVTSNTQPIDTEVKKVSIIKVTPFGQDFRLWVDIKNEGSEPIHLRILDYKLSLNDIPISEGSEDIWQTLPAFSTRSVAIDISTNVWEQFKLIIEALQDTQQINYTFNGKLITGNMILQERVYIQQADTLTANDLPLKKIERLQRLIPGFSL